MMRFSCVFEQKNVTDNHAMFGLGVAVIKCSYRMELVGGTMKSERKYKKCLRMINILYFKEALDRCENYNIEMVTIGKDAVVGAGVVVKKMFFSIP